LLNLLIFMQMAFALFSSEYCGIAIKVDKRHHMLNLVLNYRCKSPN
jgi:hypothetical protein